MKIIKTKDLKAIPFLIEPIKKFIERDNITEYDFESFLRWLRFNIYMPPVGVWIAQNEDKIVGYAIANIQTTLNSEFINVTQLYGEQEEVEFELIDNVREWAKKNALSIVLTSTKFPKKWKRMGFEVESHTLKMEV
ncbi:MAG TPA: hypothetical protein DDX29_12050 [Clostridiales bacterium]|nr:hypothetical protein [Clostridiales bacterium]